MTHQTRDQGDTIDIPLFEGEASVLIPVKFNT